MKFKAFKNEEYDHIDTNHAEEVEDNFYLIESIQKDMIEYVDDMVLPLCDYLSCNDIENFILMLE